METLFTITGRNDAGPCSISQPSFANAVAQNNIIFRILTPTFGSGLIENIEESGRSHAFRPERTGQVSGAQAFVNFMRFLAPPTPSTTVVIGIVVLCIGCYSVLYIVDFASQP